MPNHRAEAERLLLLADEVEHRGDSITVLAHRVARARVYATLALADAIAVSVAKLVEAVGDA